MKTVIILVAIFALTSCSQYAKRHDSRLDSAGPKLSCPKYSNGSIYRRLGKQDRASLSSCFDYSIDELNKKSLLIAKFEWLQAYEGDTVAILFLENVLAQFPEREDLQKQLVLAYLKTSQWEQAYNIILKSNNSNWRTIQSYTEAHLGIKPLNNQSHPPLIYQFDSPLEQANIYQSTSNFNLQRIDQANEQTLNGEPSMAASDDGQHIIVAWVDSSVESNGSVWWRLRSAWSQDGGVSWDHSDFSPFPEQVEIHHYDAMTAYDPINNHLLVGGLTLDYNGSYSALFMADWDLNQNAPTPTVTTDNNIIFDKEWAAVDDNGRLWVAEREFIFNSNDFGVSFEGQQYPLHIGRQPVNDTKGCISISSQDSFEVCQSDQLMEVYSGYFSSISFNIDSYLAGTYRAFAFAIHAYDSLGHIYLVYPDLDEASQNVAILMTRSTDNGATWEKPWVVSNSSLGNSFMPWFEIDASDNFHLLFADTRHTINNGLPAGSLDFYYSTSTDKGMSWQEQRVTPTSLATPNLVWGDYFISDYVSMDVTDSKVYLSIPWAEQNGQMHLYFASKSIELNDLIKVDGFE